MGLPLRVERRVMRWFAPSAGEALADNADNAVGAVDGATAHDLALFDPGRFAR